MRMRNASVERRIAFARFAIAGSLLVGGIALPVLATTEVGPLIVTVTTSPNPEALLATTSVAKSVGAIGYATGTSGVGLEGYVTQPGAAGVEGLSLSTSGLGGSGVFGYSANGSGVLGATSNANSSGVYGVDDAQNGSGIGVAGSGSTGVFGSGSEGVVGITTRTGYGAGYPVGAGVYGVDQTARGAVGVAGSSQSGTGVSGTSTSGAAVAGVSKTSYGVAGVSTASSGVFGETSASNGYNYSPAGVDGVATNGTGVYGSSSQGTGVAGNGSVGVVADSNYISVEAYATGASAMGVLAYASSENPYEQAVGIDVNSTGTGIFASGNNFGIEGATQAAGGTAISGFGCCSASYGGDFEAYGPNSTGLYVKTDYDSGTGIYIDATGGSIPLTVQTGVQPTTLLQLDSSGNLSLSGTLTTGDAVQSAVSDVDGKKRMTYGPRMTERTFEDTGESQLSAGRAEVAFDSSFRDVLGSAPYSVFLTPECDTPGLYVALKERGGFVVSEHNGRSNCPFSYRVVVRGGVEAGHARLDYLAMPRRVNVHEPALRQSIAAIEANIRREAPQMKIRASREPGSVVRLKHPAIVIPRAPTMPILPMRAVPVGLR